MHHIEVQLYYTNEAKQVIAIKFPSHMLCLLLHSYTNSNLYVISNDPQGAWATCAQEGALKQYIRSLVDGTKDDLSLLTNYMRNSLIYPIKC